MKKSWIFQISVLVLALVLSACGGGSGGDGGQNPNNKPQPANRVNWEAVPSEFNPRTEDVSFRTEGVEKIYVDVFGFDDDIDVVYLQDLPVNTGFLRLYKVWKESASWGDLRPRPNGKKLDLKNYGMYQCSINIKNGQIAALKGGCYVRLQVFLPVASEIEVYNVGQLISRRFIPIDTETFLESFDDATWADDKFAVIEEYLHSYNVTNKIPSLTSQQLGFVIHDFMRSKEKFKALRRLHSIVTDRENLASMIEDEFSYFDREEARKIIGL